LRRCYSGSWRGGRGDDRGRTRFDRINDIKPDGPQLFSGITKALRIQPTDLMKSSQLEKLNSKGSFFIRNTIWNLVGQAVPLIVAIFAIPLLIRHLGTSRFGILTLGWALIGYVSLFDFGIGRALTQVVAEIKGSEQAWKIPSFFWASIYFLFGFGLVAAIGSILACPFIVNSVLRIPQELRSESLSAFYLLAISLPIVIITAGLRGFLEALQRFDLVNKMRIPMGVMIFIGPLMILPFTRKLSYLIGILVVVRTIGLIAHVIICFREMPGLLDHKKFARSNISHLFRFGTWMTISNILGPLMTYLDRFFIGALLSVALVAYYATPYEVVTKLLIIPTSLACALFPAFATSFSGGDEKRVRLLFIQGLKCLFIIMFPIVLTLILFAKEAITLWLNSDFASQSTHVMQLLAFGIMINSLAQIPFALLQGIGRPDITAKLHMIEFPLYLLLFWVLVSHYGIDGAAVAWVVRVLIDLFLLILRTRVLFPINGLIVRLVAAIFSVSAISAMGSLIANPFYRGFYLLIILFAFFFLCWKLIMTAEEKKYMAQHVLRATG